MQNQFYLYKGFLWLACEDQDNLYLSISAEKLKKLLEKEGKRLLIYLLILS